MGDREQLRWSEEMWWLSDNDNYEVIVLGNSNTMEHQLVEKMAGVGHSSVFPQAGHQHLHHQQQHLHHQHHQHQSVTLEETRSDDVNYLRIRKKPNHETS